MFSDGADVDGDDDDDEPPNKMKNKLPTLTFIIWKKSKIFRFGNNHRPRIIFFFFFFWLISIPLLFLLFIHVTNIWKKESNFVNENKIKEQKKLVDVIQEIWVSEGTNESVSKMKKKKSKGQDDGWWDEKWETTWWRRISWRKIKIRKRRRSKLVRWARWWCWCSRLWWEDECGRRRPPKMSECKECMMTKMKNKNINRNNKTCK